MVEYTRASVRITKERRERWEKAIEEHTEVENLSQLIKLGVERVIEDPTREPQPVSEPIDLGEVLENQKGMKKELEAVVTRLNRIDRELQSQDTLDTEKVVFDELPDGSGTGAPPVSPPSKWAATPEEIAKTTNRPLHKVEEALQHLKETTASVESTEDDSDTYYWKKP